MGLTTRYRVWLKKGYEGPDGKWIDVPEREYPIYSGLWNYMHDISLVPRELVKIQKLTAECSCGSTDWEGIEFPSHVSIKDRDLLPVPCAECGAAKPLGFLFTPFKMRWRWVE